MKKKTRDLISCLSAVYPGAPVLLTLDLAADKHLVLRGLDVDSVLCLRAEPGPVGEEE